MDRYFNEMENENEQSFSLIANIQEDDDEQQEMVIDDELPVLPLRNMVLFPSVVIPVSVGRDSSLRLIKEANKEGKYIIVNCQKDKEIDMPDYQDMHPEGTIARVIRVLEMPNQTQTVILQGVRRACLHDFTQTSPYIKGHVVLMPEDKTNADSPELEALVQTCKETTERIIKMSNMLNPENAFAIENITNKRFLINFICTNMPLTKDERIELLQKNSLYDRAYRLLEILQKTMQLEEIKERIQLRTHEEIEQQQKEYFLQQQIKKIQDELGGSAQDQEIKDFRERASKKKWGAKIAKAFEKELAKLERTNPQSPDYNVQLNYLQTMLNLPWGLYSKDSTDLKKAERVLNKDHYGLTKVKERILEHLAVLKLKKDMKSPIICLYGPPGVGKTSLGKSIASALNRKYVRMSLGGLHDESEIRGHRKTYIGAMPGRIVKNLIKVGTSNPVFVLDEIDKISQQTMQGDPSSALLEVLDPEQNNTFHDNFIDVDYDLSNVMFVATANNISAIQPALLDRMELIPLSGYITEEKTEIARRHLVPKQLKNNGVEECELKFTKKSLEFLVESYTREAGVRNLEKQIAKIFRYIAREVATKDTCEYTTIKVNDIIKILGEPRYTRDVYQGNDYAGVVTGLAWTAVGGDILYIETSVSPGKGTRLTVTGNLGDVMKESAMLALEYIKAHANELSINSEIFNRWNIHLHVPEGAIPKDGPSAGVTMTTAIASALTQRKVRANLAMTGEITLRGRVLPVGGIKEKILAAKRAGITEIMLCEENKKDIKEIDDIYLKGLNFHYVRDVKDVLAFALLDEKVANPIDFTIKEAKEKHEI
jgi:ATP-dependent Lon protease